MRIPTAPSSFDRKKISADGWGLVRCGHEYAIGLLRLTMPGTEITMDDVREAVHLGKRGIEYFARSRPGYRPPYWLCHYPGAVEVFYQVWIYAAKYANRHNDFVRHPTRC